MITQDTDLCNTIGAIKGVMSETPTATTESGTAATTAPEGSTSAPPTSNESVPPQPEVRGGGGGSSGALVVYSSHGRSLLFHPDELVIPRRLTGEVLKQQAQIAWFSREWAKLKPLWTERIKRSAKLQTLPLDAIIEQMASSLERKYAKRRDAHKLYQKKRRLNSGAHGSPSPFVYVTNVASLKELEDRNLRSEVEEDLVQQLRHFGAILSVRYSVSAADEEEPKKAPPCATEAPIVAEDTRGGFVVQYASEQEAVAAIAQTHGRYFGGRRVVCRFALQSEKEETHKESSESGSDNDAGATG